MANDDSQAPLPWWRVRMLWLVMGGPALVVAASIATAVIAWRGGDLPLKTLSLPDADATTPAMQARNHAARPR